MIFKNKYKYPGVVWHIAYNLGTRESKAVETRLQGQLRLHSKLQASYGDIMKLSLKKLGLESEDVQKERKRKSILILPNITTTNFVIYLLVSFDSNKFPSFSSCEEWINLHKSVNLESDIRKYTVSTLDSVWKLVHICIAVISYNRYLWFCPTSPSIKLWFSCLFF